MAKAPGPNNRPLLSQRVDEIRARGHSRQAKVEVQKEHGKGSRADRAYTRYARLKTGYPQKGKKGPMAKTVDEASPD